MKGFKYVITGILLLMLFCIPVRAAAEQDLALTVKVSGYKDGAFLTDGDINTYRTSDKKGATITITAPQSMGSLYLMFDMEYGAYTITDNESGKTMTAGENYFCHEYVDLMAGFGKETSSVTIRFENGAVQLSEIRGFAPGNVAEDVQIWEAPLEGKTDLMLLSTHGDDDQLFFAGLLPYYAGELDYNVQVIYFTDHRTYNKTRYHEMLNGLWAVGVKAYPVFGDHLDFLDKSMESTYRTYAAYGVTREEMLGFMVQQIRRFDPMVIVAHDFNGEYGHGMHMVYTDLLVDALEISADASAYPDSAQTYGTWDVPKTYIHLYKENPIVLNYDKPLEAFGGMTAFEVSRQLGFPCHVSQQNTWFVKWIGYDYVAKYSWEKPEDIDPVALGLSYITEASQFKNFSPCEFGLYRSTVGEDVLKNDFLEHITTHDGRLGPEETRIEEERLEAERLEAERLEAERLEAERLEAQRLEAERLAKEEAERQEQQRLEEERLREEAAREAERATMTKLLILGGTIVVLMGALIVLLVVIGKSRKISKK